MAGNYPDVPAPRMAYDRDGTIGLQTQANWGSAPSQMSQGTLNALNSETTSAIIDTTGGHQVGLIFPQLRDITGIWKATGGGGSDIAAETSVDTTNGIDGTWVNRGSINKSVTVPSMRNTISVVSWTGIIAIRWGRLSSGNNSHTIYPCHLYGAIATGLNVDRLRLWHPTLDEPLDDNTSADGAFFDWGNVARSTTQDRTFRVKNNSATLTANSIAVTSQALTDTSPTVVGQHTFSDGGAFATSINIGNLAPGAISSLITLRRTTASNAILSLWTLRIVASATSWS